MAFIITVITGIVIGFVYDFFRVILNNSRKTKVKYVISDIIFWIIAGVFMLYAFYYSDNMNLRAYQFLAVLSGFFTYFLCFSKIFINLHLGIFKLFQFFFKILFTIGKFFVIIIMYILKCISFPFIRLYKFLLKFFKFLRNKVRINIKLMRKV